MISPDRLELGAEQHERKVLQDDQQAHGKKYLRHLGCVDDPLDEETLDQHAQHEGDTEGGRRSENRVDAERHPGVVADVHPDHQELRLREIDDRHDAEDQRQADGDHRIDAADEQAVDDRLQ